MTFVVAPDPNAHGNGDLAIRTDKGTLVALIYAGGRAREYAAVAAAALNARIHNGEVTVPPDRAPWAVYDRSGRLLFLDLAEDEEHVWQIWLGWPAAVEIDAAKRRGERACRMKVAPISGTDS